MVALLSTRTYGIAAAVLEHAEQGSLFISVHALAGRNQIAAFAKQQLDCYCLRITAAVPLRDLSNAD
jgi:hypothetical protein